MLKENRIPMVYLGGSISNNPQHLDWRIAAAESLREDGILAVSPLREKDPDGWRDSRRYAPTKVYEITHGFVDRDLIDVKRSDVILINFQIDPGWQSIGTWVEFGWADLYGTPIVVASPLRQVYAHPFIKKRAAFVGRNLTEAIKFIKFLLKPA